MATKKQKARIHMLKAALGLNRDEYEAWMSSYGATSTKDLAAWQAAQFEMALKEHAHMLGRWTDIPAGKDPELASWKQRRMIRGMWYDVSYLPDGEKERGLREFMIGRFDATPDYCEKEKVYKVVETLKAMKKNKTSGVAEAPRVGSTK